VGQVVLPNTSIQFKTDTIIIIIIIINSRIFSDTHNPAYHYYHRFSDKKIPNSSIPPSIPPSIHPFIHPLERVKSQDPVSGLSCKLTTGELPRFHLGNHPPSPLNTK